MNIQFRLGSETLSEKLIERAQIHLTKLSRFIVEQKTEAQVYVDVERESSAHTSESQWRASIHLDFAGERFNASVLGNTPDKAVDLATKDITQEVRRASAKQRTLKKKGGSLLKRLTQRFS